MTPAQEGYVLRLDLLKDGDVILESGHKPHSEIIKAKTGSNYSHAMIYLEGTIFESTKGGSVFTRVPNRFYVKNEDDLKVIRYSGELSDEALAKMAWHARTSVATTYSVPEAIRSSREKKPKTKKSTGQFCSRFVAESLNAGGIKAVDNIHYCTPADIEGAHDFSVVPDVIKKATSEEILHADASKLHPAHQKATVQWTRKAKTLLRPINNSVQTINDIYQALIDSRNPKIDKAIAKAMIDSGYTKNLDDDRVANSYRYDENEFSKLLREGRIDLSREVRKEVHITRLFIRNHKINRHNIKITHGMFRSLELEYEVSAGNLMAINDRMETLISACVDMNISTNSVEVARQITRSIQEALNY
ncbi:hypothetical protein [Pseudomonas sp. NUPR-001]|uniref:hypothetical protein n=1 Tax=Pseudomonas sp. NUPR-001 TaxID=3416058 RepID=UPI003F96ABE1